jgi:hypothetical protein
MTFTEVPRILSENSSLRCFSCEARRASHVCCFRWDGMQVHACLCAECMKLDTASLVEKVLRYRKEDYQTDQGFDSQRFDLRST